MFTGIVEEVGEVIELQRHPDSAVLRLRGPRVSADVTPGASIAVNGVCLTVVEHDADSFSVDVMEQTLHLSSLGDLAPGDRVNMERAMPAAGRFGGHVVQGHVDGTGRIVAREPGQAWDVLTISLPEHLARYLVPQGSITVDGVSLTVSALLADAFQVSLIPTTLDATVLGAAAVGARVNLEVDVLAKYVERLLASTGQGGRS